MERGQGGPVSDVDPSSGRRKERRMSVLLVSVAAERGPLRSLFHPAQTNPAGRQTDATLVNIFWGLLAEQTSPTGRCRQAYRAQPSQRSSSAIAAPEEELSTLSPLCWGEKHSFLLLWLRWRARRSSEAKTTRPEQTRPRPEAPRRTRPFWHGEEIREIQRRCLFSV